jgi:hypothetical protein
VEYDPAEYIQTAAGLRVSRKALICSAQNVEMPGGKVITLLVLPYI